MINSSASFQEAIAKDSRTFRVRFLADGQEISGDVRKLRIFKGSCGSSSLKPGTAFCPYMEAEVDNCQEALEGVELEVKIGVMTGGSLSSPVYDEIRMGYFTVGKPQTSTLRTTFMAYGRLHSKMSDYMDSVPLTLTAGNVASLVSARTGVTVSFEDGIDQNAPISQTFNVRASYPGITYRDALGIAASVVGGYATETADGEVCIRKFSSSPTFSCSAERMQTAPVFGDYDTEITGVKVTVKETGAAGEGESYSYGTPVNLELESEYMTEAAFEEYRSNLVGLTYREGEIELTLGDPRLEPWDVLNVEVTESVNRIVPCMGIEHIFDGGLQTIIKAPNPEDTENTEGPVTRAIRIVQDSVRTGVDGLNQSKLFLYKRAAEEPQGPAGYITYNFETGELSLTDGGEGELVDTSGNYITDELGNHIVVFVTMDGWQTSIPGTDGTPCWVVSASAIGREATADIAPSEWSAVSKMVEDGVSVTLIQNFYAVSPSPDTQPTSGWVTDASSVSMTETNRYLWNYELIVKSDGTTVVDTPHVIGVYGVSGGDGVGIAGITEYYARSQTSAEPPAADFDTQRKTPTNTYKYLWNFEVISYTDGSSYVSQKHIIGVYGDKPVIAASKEGQVTTITSDGAEIATILDGEDGNSPVITTQKTGDVTKIYADGVEIGSVSDGTDGQTPVITASKQNGVTTISANGTAIAAVNDGSSVMIRSATKAGDVTTIILEDGNGTQTLSIADGQDGTNGAPGASGYVHIAWATSADGSTGFSTSDSTDKTYLGSYTDNTQADSLDPTDYNWSLIKGEKGDTGAKGDKGDTGDAAYNYELLCSPSAVSKASSADTPAAVAFSARRSQGTGAPAGYAGRFVIATSADGSAWTTRYTSQADESGKTYTAPSDAKYIRCQLYLSGGTSTLLDTQTVPVISDGAAGGKGDRGDDGADAYTVVLTNESHTFPAGTENALPGSAACNVIAFKGTAQVAATIGTISGQAQGMTTSVSQNGTTGAYFTVTVDGTLSTRSGTLTVPITVDGKNFTKDFTWSLSLTGATGETGAKGDPGDTLTILTTHTDTAVIYTARLMIGGVDATTDYEPTDFAWSFKNVDDLELIGYGYAISVDKADLSYGKVVALTWTKSGYACLKDGAGNYIMDAGGNRILAKTEVA